MPRGMTQKKKTIRYLKQRLKTSSETIHPDMLIPEIEIDAEIRFTEITPN
jgi:single-stranded-DNA-specific exonuclease